MKNNLRMLALLPATASYPFAFQAGAGDAVSDPAISFTEGSIGGDIAKVNLTTGELCDVDFYLTQLKGHTEREYHPRS